MKNLPLSLLVLIFTLFATTASAQVDSEQSTQFPDRRDPHRFNYYAARDTASETAMGR